jgi:hypothetical protein
MASRWFFVITSARPGPVAFGSIRSVGTPGKMARQPAPSLMRRTIPSSSRSLGCDFRPSSELWRIAIDRIRAFAFEQGGVARPDPRPDANGMLSLTVAADTKFLTPVA